VKQETTSSVSAVGPLSMTMISSIWRVCLARPSSVRLTSAARFNVMMISELVIP